MPEIIITLLYCNGPFASKRLRATRASDENSNPVAEKLWRFSFFFLFAWHDEGSPPPFPSPFLFHTPRYVYIYIHRYPTRGDGWFELLARGYLSTPCKVVAIHRRHSSIPCASSGGEEGWAVGVEVESSFARVLTSPTSSSSFSPLPPIFHESPSVSPSGEEDSAANPRASRRRLQRERRKPYSYATLPPRC